MHSLWIIFIKIIHRNPSIKEKTLTHKNQYSNIYSLGKGTAKTLLLKWNMATI